MAKLNSAFFHLESFKQTEMSFGYKWQKLLAMMKQALGIYGKNSPIINKDISYPCSACLYFMTTVTGMKKYAYTLRS
jgi:hypothetical protein